MNWLIVVAAGALLGACAGGFERNTPELWLAVLLATIWSSSSVPC